MPKSPHRPNLSLFPSPPNHADAIAHQEQWQAHLDARRLGNNPPTDPKTLARHARNELAVLGKRALGVW